LQVEQYFSLVKLLSNGISFGLKASRIISSTGLAPYGPMAKGGHCFGINPGFFNDTLARNNKDKKVKRR
jgi:hypothetical protein